MTLERLSAHALVAGAGPSVVLDDAAIAAAVAASRTNGRGRVIVRFHESDGDPLQRMINVMQPGSYVQPHRHLHPPRAEWISVLRGSVDYFEFNEAGSVMRRQRLSADGPAYGMDIRPGTIHTFTPMEPDTVLVEAKPGPYAPASDKDFMEWAPREGDPAAAGYLKTLLGG